MKLTYLKKSVLGLGFALLVLTQVKGQENSSLLWKISGNGLEQESYLFGTIHMICSEEFKMDSRIETAFSKTGQLVLELDMDDPSMQQKLQALSLNPEMKNIKSQLSEEDALALDSFLKTNYGAGLDQLGILKPFVLTSMILMKQMPCSQIESYEMYFTNKATQEQKEVLGLETVEFQMGIFEKIPDEVELEEVGKMVTSDYTQKEFAKLVEKYLEEDVDGLYRLMTDNPMMKAYGTLLLDERNKAWIQTMQDYMAKKPTFFAVGSGHLGGEFGVINLLRKSGYQVIPVN